ncbi:MAG: hypothetical protein ACLQVK_13685 [Acidimicrobiales bacterium]
MSAILDKPVAPSRAPGKGGVYRRRPLDRARKMTPMGFLVLVALIYLFIMVTFVLSTMRSQQSLVRQGPFGPLSLGRLGFDWRQLQGFSDGIYFTWLKNSAIVAFGGAVLAVLVARPAGYVLAMLHFPGRRPCCSLPSSPW